MKHKYIFTAVLLCLISAISFAAVKLVGNRYEKNDSYVVVTSFYPIYIAALNVTDGIENLTVQNLTEPTTGCLHDYQLTTEDLKLLERADVLLINGGGMESFLDDVIKRFPDLEVVETSQESSMLPSSEEWEEEDDGDAHSHGALNAHVWMDIDEYERQVETIKTAMCRVDAAHASQYQQNVDSYKKKLEELKEKAALLRGQSDAGMALFHDAFAYLARMCGFETVKIINMDEETSLSAAQVGEAVDLVKQNSVKYLLSDEIYGKKTAQAVEQETGVVVIYLDTLVTGAYEKDAYLRGMEKNLENLKEALQTGEEP